MSAMYNSTHFNINIMSLKEIIVADNIQALKNKETEKRMVLSTLIGELDRKGKNPSDADVIKTVKSMVEGCKMCKKENEIPYLEVYLPQMLSEQELYAIVRNEIMAGNVSGMKDMGKMMTHLQNNYAGQYDGKEASNIVRVLLA